MIKRILAILFLSIQATAQPVTFQKLVQNTASIEILSAAPTRDGGMIAAGRTPGSGAMYYDRNYVVRIDSVGAIKWSRSYADTGMMYPQHVIQTSTGEFLVTGYIEYRTSAYGAFATKLSASGDVIWYKALPGQEGLTVTELPDGYLFTGAYPKTYAPGTYLIKTDTAGNLTWSRHYHLGGSEMRFHALAKANDGGFLLAGSANSSDLLLMKTTAAGTVSWLKAYPATGSFQNFATSCVQAPDGGFVVAGYLGTTLNGRESASLLYKVNDTGGVVWGKRYTMSTQDVPHSVVRCTGGGYAISGVTLRNYNGGNDGYVIRTDDSGGVRWTKLLGRIDRSEEFRYGYQSADGGFFFGGSTFGYGQPGVRTAIFVKTDSSGNAGCNTADTSIVPEPLAMRAVSFPLSIGTFPDDFNTRSFAVANLGSGLVLCSTLDVQEAGLAPEVEVLPNPSNVNVSIRTPGQRIRSLRLTGISGQVVYENERIGSEQARIDVSAIPSGIYFYTITTTSLQTARGKLIVAH